MNMGFYWVNDRKLQGHLFIYWVPVKKNTVDYFTKHYLPSHHTVMRHE